MPSLPGALPSLSFIIGQALNPAQPGPAH